MGRIESNVAGMEVGRGVRFFCIAAIVAGLVGRLTYYLINRSLWLDEAMISLNIADRPWSALWETLSYTQAAPIGFLLAEKASTLTFGVNELALRLFPFIASCLALILFSQLAWQALAPNGTAAAIFIFAVSPSLIYFGSEVKPYSVDVLASVILLLLAIRYQNLPNRGRLSALAFAGAGLIWFSYPAMFSIASIGIVLVLESLLSKQKERIPLLLGCGAVWVLSFTVLYLSSLHGLASNQVMKEFWQDSFLNFPPLSFEDVVQYIEAVWEFVKNLWVYAYRDSLMRTVAAGVCACLLTAGFVSLSRKARVHECILVGPLVVVLLLAMASIYPIDSRLVLFTIPSVVMIAAAGFDAVSNQLYIKSSMAVAAMFIVCVSAALLSARELFGTPYREELRPVMIHIAQQKSIDTAVYVHSGAVHAFKYYSKYCGECRIESPKVIHGKFLKPNSTAEELASELVPLRSYKETWIVFSHRWWDWSEAQENQMITEMSQFGVVTEKVERYGARGIRFVFR